MSDIEMEVTGTAFEWAEWTQLGQDGSSGEQ